MKRVAAISVVTLAILAASLPTCAQGLMGFQPSLPGAGLFGQYFEGLGNGQQLTPTVYVGYVTHSKGVRFHSDYYEEDYFEDISTPLQGLWLGASLKLRAGDDLGFMLKGGALIACNPRADDETSYADTQGAFHFSYYRPTPRNQWSIVDALATYEIYDSFQVIGGFRWEHFSTILEYRGPTGSGDVHHKINAYLPVVGVETRHGNAQTSASAGILGFPVVPGNFRLEWNGWSDQSHEVSSQFWNRGYFLECFFRFSQRVNGTTALGAFATYNVLHAITGHGSYDWNNATDAGSEGLEYVFNRQAWTVGGSIAIMFTTL